MYHILFRICDNIGESRDNHRRKAPYPRTQKRDASGWEFNCAIIIMVTVKKTAL